MRLKLDKETNERMEGLFNPSLLKSAIQDFRDEGFDNPEIRKFLIKKLFMFTK